MSGATTTITPQTPTSRQTLVPILTRNSRCGGGWLVVVGCGVVGFGVVAGWWCGLLVVVVV